MVMCIHGGPAEQCMSQEDHNKLPDTLTDSEMIRATYEMVAELMEVLRPLKAMAAGLGPMQKMGMSPAAKEAAARIKALS